MWNLQNNSNKIISKLYLGGEVSQKGKTKAHLSNKDNDEIVPEWQVSLVA